MSQYSHIKECSATFFFFARSDPLSPLTNATDFLPFTAASPPLHRRPLAAADVNCLPDGTGPRWRDRAFASMCLNVNSMSRTDVCDNQDPAKLYSLQPAEVSHS